MGNFTRREILTAFLGLPAGLAACRSSAAPSLPEGIIVGASDEAGHRVRDRFRIEVTPENWENVGLVIVGGGVAGLSAAWRLRQAGFTDFVLLELEVVLEAQVKRYKLYDKLKHKLGPMSVEW